MTLNQYLDRWLPLAARPNLRAKSYTDDVALLARYIRAALGCFKLNQLTPLDIQSAPSLSLNGATGQITCFCAVPRLAVIFY